MCDLTQSAALSSFSRSAFHHSLGEDFVNSHIPTHSHSHIPTIHTYSGLCNFSPGYFKVFCSFKVAHMYVSDNMKRGIDSLSVAGEEARKYMSTHPLGANVGNLLYQ